MDKSRPTLAEGLEALHAQGIGLQFSPDTPAKDAQGNGAKMGRPPRLRPTDEWELYCYRKSGVSIKTCASMFRVSVPTVNRIIAKFRAYDAAAGAAWKEFKGKMDALRAVAEVAHG